MIHSPHTVAVETPIQPVYARGIRGQVEVFSQFTEGLQDLDGFSHIYLVYQFHKAGPVKLLVKPYLEDVPRGVFATRAPSRPNPIGISIVRLEKIEGSVLFIAETDMLDGSPLLDIKPYIPHYDMRRDALSGWFAEDPEWLKPHFADDRFS